MQSLSNRQTAACSVGLWVVPLFGLWETRSSLLSSFVFPSLHFAGWRWGIDQKQNGWAVLQDPPVLADFKAGWVRVCVAGCGCGCAWHRERKKERERALERMYMCDMHVDANARVLLCLCGRGFTPPCLSVGLPVDPALHSQNPLSSWLWNNSAKCFAGVLLCPLYPALCLLRKSHSPEDFMSSYRKTTTIKWYWQKWWCYEGRDGIWDCLGLFSFRYPLFSCFSDLTAYGVSF